MKKVRLFLTYKALMDIGDVISSTPDMSVIMSEDFDDSLCGTCSLKFRFDKDIQELESILSLNVSGKYTITADQPSGSEPAVTDNTGKNKVQPKIEEHSIRQETIPAKEREEQSKNIIQNKVKEYIKVEKDKLDLLFNIVGELFIKKSNYNQTYSKLEDIQLKQISQGFSDPDLSNFIDYLGMLNKSHDRQLNDLQQISNSLRMVQLKDSFSRFSMAVRKLKSDLHKDIELEIIGENTEVDKIISEKLADPLLHMIRNSVDHGIETREERIHAGKNPIGKITLKAFNSGNNVIIKVEDDGKGLDANKLYIAAVRKGMIKDYETSDMSYEEKLNLIFLPGFSTAEEVTDISGRGVGMDVVKRNIDSIKGKILIETKLGVGTSFIIKLPLTLAIIRALLVNIENTVYAFPSDAVVTVEKVAISQLESINSQKVLKFRNRVVPIFDLKETFKIKNTLETKEFINIVIVSQAYDYFGFCVDSFLSQQHIVIKDIEGTYHKGGEVLGAAILGDGKLSMVVDIPMLISTCSKQ